MSAASQKPRVSLAPQSKANRSREPLSRIRPTTPRPACGRTCSLAIRCRGCGGHAHRRLRYRGSVRGSQPVDGPPVSAAAGGLRLTCARRSSWRCQPARRHCRPSGGAAGGHADHGPGASIRAAALGYHDRDRRLSGKGVRRRAPVCKQALKPGPPAQPLFTTLVLQLFVPFRGDSAGLIPLSGTAAGRNRPDPASKSGIRARFPAIRRRCS
jgi:hypothetical protein